MARRMRKMRRRPLRRSMTRMRRTRYVRRSRTRKSTCKTEVKYLTLIGNSQAITAYSPLTGQSKLPGSANLLNNALVNLRSGTSPANVVGRKIFVKRLTFYAYVYLCPGEATYLSSALIRFIFHNANVTQGNDITNFFGDSARNNISPMVNRASVNVYYDKTYSLAGGYPIYWSSGTTVYGVGACRKIRISFPINRACEFSSISTDPNTAATLKNDENVISLAVCGGTPYVGFVSAQNKQVACMDYTLRIYYTDC